jgi:hypothetical protein
LSIVLPNSLYSESLQPPEATEVKTLKKIAILLIAFQFTAGCSKESRKEIGKLLDLKNSITKEMQVEDVRITLHNGVMISAAFVNTKYNGASDSIQEDVRQKTLQLISAHFPQESDIKSAQISFIIQEKKFFIINYTDALNSAFFQRNPDGSWKRS